MRQAGQDACKRGGAPAAAAGAPAASAHARVDKLSFAPARWRRWMAPAPSSAAAGSRATRRPRGAARSAWCAGPAWADGRAGGWRASGEHRAAVRCAGCAPVAKACNSASKRSRKHTQCERTSLSWSMPSSAIAVDSRAGRLGGAAPSPAHTRAHRGRQQRQGAELRRACGTLSSWRCHVAAARQQPAAAQPRCATPPSHGGGRPRGARTVGDLREQQAAGGARGGGLDVRRRVSCGFDDRVCHWVGGGRGVLSANAGTWASVVPAALRLRAPSATCARPRATLLIHPAPKESSPTKRDRRPCASSRTAACCAMAAAACAAPMRSLTRLDAGASGPPGPSSAAASSSPLQCLQ